MSESKAIVWRESAYRTGKCCKCCRTVLKDGTVPTGVYEFASALLCSGCGNFVAILKPYEGELPPGSRGGRWEGGL